MNCRSCHKKLDSIETELVFFDIERIKGDLDSFPISIGFVKVQKGIIIEGMKIFINWQAAIIRQARPKQHLFNLLKKQMKCSQKGGEEVLTKSSILSYVYVKLGHKGRGHI